MKKVGIITITHGTNYGNRLQNYATQKVLEDLGVKAETIYHYYGKGGKSQSFYNKLIGKIYDVKKNNLRYLLNQVIRRKLNNKAKQEREKSFAEFNNKYIKFSKFKTTSYDIPSELDANYDYFLCGSDQIWNPYHTESANVYFLTFTKYEKSIAFAPSLGVSEFPYEMRQSYIKMINQIKYLSVREKAGYDIIRELTGRKAEVLVDPTLLLNREEWLEISKEPKCKPKSNYILTYFLGEKDKSSIRRIEIIAKENKMEVFNLLDRNNIEKYSVNPSEFIALIKDASLVCTDSFHGSVFSIIMRVPFIVFERKGKEISMNSRIDTLLSTLKLKSRLDKNIISNDQIFNLDYEEIQGILNLEKEKSINFLKKSLV